MLAAYRKINGIASDLRFVADAYTVQPSEILMVCDVLPPISTLNDAIVNSASSADASRLQSIDDAISSTSIGQVQPATIAQLKAMTNAQFSSWFDANFTTAAQAIALLKALSRVIVRRVL